MTWNERLAVTQMFVRARRSNEYIASQLGLSTSEVKQFTRDLKRDALPHSRESERWETERTGEEIE